MTKPQLTKDRITLAYTIAVIADLLEFPITAAELTIVGAPGGEFSAGVLDCIVMAAMTKLLGFHWTFLPSFCVEVIPGLDLLPTWVGSVAFVVWQRKKEVSERRQPPRLTVIDVEEVKPAWDSPVTKLRAPPPLPQSARAAYQVPRPAPEESALEARLRKLNELFARNLISQSEFDAKRQQILADI